METIYIAFDIAFSIAFLFTPSFIGLIIVRLSCKEFSPEEVYSSTFKGTAFMCGILTGYFCIFFDIAFLIPLVVRAILGDEAGMFPEWSFDWYLPELYLFGIPFVASLFAATRYTDDKMSRWIKKRRDDRKHMIR
jgi:hypothetical protein